jgi:hypothetical protein
MTVDVRQLLLDSLQDVKQSPAVALSGGLDSTSILFALQELNKDPRAYTFHVKDVVSEDLRESRRVCDTFDVPLTEVTLPNDHATIKRDTYAIVEGLGLKQKTAIECTWPFLYLYEEVTEDSIALGNAGDGHFVISREAMINKINEDVERMDHFRNSLFGDPTYSQVNIHRQLAPVYGIQHLHIPYYERPFVNAFLGTAWQDINKPKQKQPIIDAYPDKFNQINVRKHTNLQKGDSEIAEQFNKLLETNWNIQGWKSPVGIYNAIAKGDLPP